MSDRAELDALTLEVILSRLISATDEAAETLKRTSFSMLVTESNDLACVVTDVEGRLIAQSTDSIPAFIGTLPVTIKHLLGRFGADIREGDLLATNDPWIASGHLNDITLVKPLFSRGRLVGFGGSCAHAPDIGGRGRSLESREIFEEGFIIPPMKIVRAGVADETFFQLYRAASRMPLESEGDIWAAANSLALIESRVARILKEYELDDLTRISQEINSRSETLMRERIRSLADGVYRHELRADGVDEPLIFNVCLTVSDGHIHCDYSGTSASVARAINCPQSYTSAMTAYALKCLLLQDLPSCEGPLKCFSIFAPEGSIINPSYPSAVAGRAAVGQYIPPLIFGALAEVMPGIVMATPGSPLWSCVQTGHNRDGRRVSNTLFFNGGMGATSQNDGEPCYSWPSNVSNVPVEMVEVTSPIFVHYKRLAHDTGGRGRRRGGLGLETSFEIESDLPVSFNFIAERCRFPAQGLLGGEAGAPGMLLVNGEKTDHRKDLHLRRGDTVLVRTPGGAGLGPSEEREQALIDQDFKLGYITLW